jgi:hypothetical protein
MGSRCHGGSCDPRARALATSAGQSVNAQVDEAWDTPDQAPRQSASERASATKSRTPNPVPPLGV